MFRFCCTKLIHHGIPNSRTLNLLISLQTQSRKFNSNQHSPTITYLINKCGLTLNSAISASQKLTIRNTVKSDSVIQLLKDYDFTPTMITTIITKNPKLLLCKPLKTLKPKLEFFKSSGFSNEDIAQLVRSDSRSLSNHFVPLYNFLRRFIHTNQDVVNALLKIRYGHVSIDNVLLMAESNIQVLRHYDVPEPLTHWLLIRHPKAITLKSDQFKEIVRVIEGMNFHPHSQSFVHAIGVMGGISSLDWGKRVETYKSSGMSEEDVVSAFKLQPNFMTTSNTKIRKLMDFYMNELGLKPSYISKHPNLMMISLEKRVIPRCSVLLLLLANGLIENDIHLASVLTQSSKKFEMKYVLKYQEIVLNLLKAYHGELEHPKWETFRERLQCVD
ncbi:hypothetical protein ACHQM5_010650 [Ranunculus cassubicifolius]